MSTKPSIRVAVLGAALAGGAVAGALLAAPVISGAQQTSASSSASAAAPAKRAMSVRPQTAPTDPNATQADPNQSGQQQGPRGPKGDPSKGGHVGQNGVKEEIVTGDNAEKIKAAALAAVPGGTVERVETDAEGAAFEAHMTTADGKDVTVKLDANFTVTSTEDGHR